MCEKMDSATMRAMSIKSEHWSSGMVGMLHLLRLLVPEVPLYNCTWGLNFSIRRLSSVPFQPVVSLRAFSRRDVAGWFSVVEVNVGGGPV